MQNVKRDKFDIVQKMLDIAREPVKKTHLIYRANINFAQLVRYLNFLVSSGMLEYIEEPFRGYRTTEKGLRFLALFDIDGSDSTNKVDWSSGMQTINNSRWINVC